MIGRLWDRWVHPGHALLLGYAENTLSERHARRVRRHMAYCDRCRDEVQLNTEALHWLVRALSGEPSAVLEALRMRIVAQVRGETPPVGVGACASECLGPQGFMHLALRLRRFKGGAPPPVAVAGPMLSAFLGRKVLGGSESPV
jgi:hypothetical protein